MHSSPAPEQRLVELWRENGALRSELTFYRTCFDNTIRFVDRVYDISKELFLLYYYQPQSSRTETSDGHRIALELQDAIDDWQAAAMEAEEEWLSLWGIQDSNISLIDGRF